MQTVVGTIKSIEDASVEGKEKKVIVHLSIERENLYIAFVNNLKMFENYKKNDIVKITFSYNGSLYKGRYFNNLNGHTISLEQ